MLKRYSLHNLANLYPKTRDVLQEQTFLTLLGHEHRRAKRSRKSFVLIQLDVDKLLKQSVEGDLVNRVVSVLSISTRSTDHMGWYKTGKILGIVFTEVSLEKQESVSQVLYAKVVRALQSQLGTAISSKIHLTIQPSSPAVEQEALATVAS